MGAIQEAASQILAVLAQHNEKSPSALRKAPTMRFAPLLLIAMLVLGGRPARSLEIGVNVGAPLIAKLSNPTRTAAFHTLVDTLSARDINYIRISIPFWDLVPNDTTQTIDFTPFDNLITYAHDNNIHILAILGCSSPPFAMPLSRFSCSWPEAYYYNGTFTGGTLAKSPPTDAYWQYYVRAVVGHYAHEVDAWEVLNEPNFFGEFFLGTTLEYRNLLLMASSAIRHLDPTAVIALGGMATMYYQGTTWLECLLGTDPAIYASFDVLNVHTYELDADYAVQAVFDAVSHKGLAPKPLWVTEAGMINSPDAIGNQFHSLDGQAFHVPFLLNKLRALGAARVYWYGYETFPYGDSYPFALSTFADANYTALVPLQSWSYFCNQATQGAVDYVDAAALQFSTQGSSALPEFRGLYPYQRCNLYNCAWSRFSTFERADVYGQTGVLTNRKPPTQECGEAFTGIAIDVDDSWATIDSNRTSVLCEVSFARASSEGALAVLYDRVGREGEVPTQTDNSGTCPELLLAGADSVSHTNTFETYYDGLSLPTGRRDLVPPQSAHETFVRAVAELDSASWTNRLYRKGDIFLQASDSSQFYLDSVRLISRQYPYPMGQWPVASSFATNDFRVCGASLYWVNSNVLRRYDVSRPDSITLLPAIPYLPQSVRAAASNSAVLGVATQYNGVLLYDIANQENPVFKSAITMDYQWADNIAIQDTIAIVPWSYGGVGLYGVAHPELPVAIGAVSVCCEVCRVIATQGRAYLLGYNRLIVLDLSNPASAFIAGEFAFPFAMDCWRVFDLAVVGNRAFVACGDKGTWCIDVTDPGAMEVIKVLPSPKGAAWCSADSAQVCIGDSTGITAYKRGPNDNYELWGHRHYDGGASVALHGGLAFVRAGTSCSPGGMVGAARAPLAEDQAIVSGSVNMRVIATEEGREDWIFEWETVAWNAPDSDEVRVCPASGTPLVCSGGEETYDGSGRAIVRMGPNGLFKHTLTVRGIVCVPQRRYKYAVGSCAGGNVVWSADQTFKTPVCLEEE